MLSARELSFSYRRGSPPVIQNWSAEFPEGTTTALVGTSGRGKSTLLYLLGLMLQPSSGEIVVGGTSATRLSDSRKARLRATKFGFVFQDAALDQTRTVLDNVTETALYRGERRSIATERALALLDRFRVNVASDRRPGQVSGGQAQRIALCRALLSNPRILLADEPTGNLDPGTASVVVRALREHASSGATVIIVTHSPEVADSCDRTLQL